MMNESQRRIKKILDSTGFDVGNQCSDGEAYVKRIKPTLLYRLCYEFKDEVNEDEPATSTSGS